MSTPFPGRPAGTTKQSLSESRRRLVELIQWVGFGRIENLRVAAREPVLDPLPAAVREHRFGSDNGPHPKLQAHDFLLKEQVTDLFRQLDVIRDGTIAILDVRHGLPFRMFLAGRPPCPAR
jgi:hypothetical protein